MVYIQTDTIRRKRKIPACQFHDLCKSEGAEYHHSSVRQGYTSVPEYRDGINTIANYNGRFGKGYVRFTPHFLPNGKICKYYCDYDYYIIKEDA